MSKGKSDKITYKAYEQNQMYLIPPDHLVRMASGTIDKMGIQQLLEQHQIGGGASRIIQYLKETGNN